MAAHPNGFLLNGSLCLKQIRSLAIARLLGILAPPSPAIAPSPRGQAAQSGEQRFGFDERPGGEGDGTAVDKVGELDNSQTPSGKIQLMDQLLIWLVSTCRMFEHFVVGPW